ncbi:MAG TPA: polymer-forming cytoskeletal protein [Desulfobacterales bacterium]|nr:polymer-forming cytoskeletal protein [Desulfobacterales bacterium]
MLKRNRNATVEPPAPSMSVDVDQKTVIGDQISIEGAIRGKENLLIEGSVKGSIEVKAHHLTVGVKGQVEAEILAANVTVSGRLAGNINATGRVEITKEADFNGQIKARSISVEDGAYLKAVIEMDREPLKSVSPSGKPEEKTSFEPIKEPLILAGKGSKVN